MQSQIYNQKFIANHTLVYWAINLQLVYLITNIMMYENQLLACCALLIGYCVVGQLPQPIKPNRFLMPLVSILTTTMLWFDLPWLAGASIILNHWLQGEQPIRPKIIGINIILIQVPLITYCILLIIHGLTINQTVPSSRTISLNIRYFPPLQKLLADQLILLGLATATIWIYLLSLPSLPPSDLLFAILPCCFVSYLIQHQKTVKESFLKPGYITLYLGLACFAQICNLFFLPHLEFWLTNISSGHMLLLILQQIIQATAFSSLFLVFQEQFSIYQNLSRKRNTEGFHFIYSISMTSTIILTSIWMIQQQNILLCANILLLLTCLSFILTMLRYPAPTLKASLQCSINYLFRIKIHGMDKLDNLKKPYILIPNHLSYIEPPILAGILPGRFMFPISLGASNLWCVRITEKFWTKLPISPDKPFTLKPFIQGLKHGKVGIIFPEGQRSPYGKLAKIYSGSILAAKMTQASLIPVFISGSEYHISSRVRTAYKKRLRPSISVQIGEPYKINKKSTITDQDIRNMMINTQNTMPKKTHLRDAIDELIIQIGSKHHTLIYQNKHLTLSQLLKKADNITWAHEKFYHITETSFCPIRFLSALLNNISIIYGNINTIKYPMHAIYNVTNEEVITFSMQEIMMAVYQWNHNSPVYSYDLLLLSCSTNEFRQLLFGFIGSILLGNTCIISTSKTNLAQKIYLESATKLMTNSNTFEALYDTATSSELVSLRASITTNINTSKKDEWEAKFTHPVYAFSYNKNTLLNSFESAFGNSETS